MYSYAPQFSTVLTRITGISSRLCPFCKFYFFSHELSSTIIKKELTEGVGHLTDKQKV